VSIGLVDTTVILHYFRNHAAARIWVDAQAVALSITSITWLEVMSGANNKVNQTQSKSILSKFELLYVTSLDQQWAMQELERFQFSHHIGMNDCLIAAVAHRLQIPLYTHNLKDMIPLIGQLAIQPYP
jgi:predicted nucleic acid-binding protein